MSVETVMSLENLKDDILKIRVQSDLDYESVKTVKDAVMRKINQYIEEEVV